MAKPRQNWPHHGKARHLCAPSARRSGKISRRGGRDDPVQPEQQRGDLEGSGPHQPQPDHHALFNCQAILSANADLWTTIAGYNQDIGIAISGGAYPTVAGQPEGWKESDGFAGTFSPNAAYLETTKRLLAGTSYTIKLVWKSNKPTPASGPQGATALIAAGAGPIPAGSSTFSPTRLAAQLIVDI